MSEPLLARVDPRLVHATLLNAWVPSLGARRIIVADEDVVRDRRRRAIYELSSTDVPIEFVAERDVGTALKERGDVGRTIVLFSTLGDAFAAINSGLELRRLNLGHVPVAADRARHHDAVYLGPREHEIIDKIEARGIEVYVQPLPQDEVETTGETPIPTLPPPTVKTATRARAPAPENSLTGQVTVVNERGLHLRAAHILAQEASRLTAGIEVGRDGVWVNAKSLLGLTTLGAACGTVLDVRVTGPDQELALEAIQRVFAVGFYEGADP